MGNLHELAKFGDRLSYLYAEHAVIEQCDKAIAVHRADGTTPVPAAALGLLILGPGTKISHAAVRALADNGCQIIWAGEHGVRFYAHGLGGSRHSRNLIRQARLVSNEMTRLQVVIRMYCLRFDDPVDPGLTLQQIRGKEGIRVRQAYADASRATGMPWHGRSYKRQDWQAADPVNRALSAANAALYGLAHAAILAGGYSPALGFIHTGKQLSFVYDVADLYKVEFTIPAAFHVAASNPTDIERSVRITCRDAFRKARLMEQVLPDIQHVLDVPEEAGDEFADDEAKPAALWQPRSWEEDVPVGRILRIRPDADMKPRRAVADGRDDRGTSDSLPAG